MNRRPTPHTMAVRDSYPHVAELPFAHVIVLGAPRCDRRRNEQRRRSLAVPLKASPFRALPCWSMLATLALLAGCAASLKPNSGGPVRAFAQPPEWASRLSSAQPLCTVAADEARKNALAAGIAPARMQWLYGRKPFLEVGHVSLVIDGWIVVDNGGLGRNLWGAPICPDNVCTLAEARRGYEISFLQSSAVALRTELDSGELRGYVTSQN